MCRCAAQCLAEHLMSFMWGSSYVKSILEKVPKGLWLSNGTGKS